MHRRIGMYMIGVLTLAILAACGQAAPQTTIGDPAVAPTPTSPDGPAPTATTSQPSETAAAAVTHGGPVRDHVSLIDHLRAQGLAADPVGSVEQPFLRAKGTTVRISGGPLTQPAEVQSYDYNDADFGGNGAAAAEADAQQLDKEGNPRTMMITWVAPPHFFRKERAFVIYLGDDPVVLKVLTEALGPQFAGR